MVREVEDARLGAHAAPRHRAARPGGPGRHPLGRAGRRRAQRGGVRRPARPVRRPRSPPSARKESADDRRCRSVEIVEVAPRDGFQPIGPWIPTETKIAFLRRLAAAGLRRIEIGSFVSAAAVPQLRDAAELLDAAAGMPGLRPQVLVPTARRGRDAVAAGARFLVYVLSVSEAHNRSNVRRSPAESAEDYARLLDGLPARGRGADQPRHRLRLPLRGTGAGRRPALDLLGRLVALRPDVEVCLCDTTGRATPDHVAQLSAEAAASLPAGRGLGLPRARHLRPRPRHHLRRVPGGPAGVRRRRGRAGRLPLRARRHGQRGDRGRRLDVRADGDRHRRGPRRPAAGGADAAALPGASAGGRARDALLAGAGGLRGARAAAGGGQAPDQSRPRNRRRRQEQGWREETPWP